MTRLPRPVRDRLPEGAERLMTPAEVSLMFRVGPKQVTRWANQGLLSSVRTLGNHRRYREAEVLAWLAATRQERVR